MPNENPQHVDPIEDMTGDSVPVPADNHPAPGVQHTPPAGYLAHDLENGVTVNTTKGTL
jgi:hypothetical protein